MENYDDISAFRTKTQQAELEFQTFTDDNVKLNSSWALLNELINYRAAMPVKPATTDKRWQSLTDEAATPPTISEVKPTLVAVEPVAERENGSLRSLLKKAGQ